MIITAILNVIFTFIQFILSPLLLLPDVTLDPNFSSSLTTAGTYYHSLNGILPIDTMLQILGVSIALESAYLFYKLLMWLLRKVPVPIS